MSSRKKGGEPPLDPPGRTGGEPPRTPPMTVMNQRKRPPNERKRVRGVPPPYDGSAGDSAPLRRL